MASNGTSCTTVHGSTIFAYKTHNPVCKKLHRISPKKNSTTHHESMNTVLVAGLDAGVNKARLVCWYSVKQEELLVSGKETQVSESDSTSSKLVLVIGGSGGVAFPSRRWDGDNTPEKVDWEGIHNLVAALPPTLKRFVLVSSVGVTKFNELPWSIMNMFGVLKFKKMGEDCVRNCGVPYTIIRPGRLTDGPYTSYDLNTLLKATVGQRRAVVIGQGDKLMGEVSRLVVAEACIQALDIKSTEGQIYEINSIEGDGPGSNTEKWKELFQKAESS